MIKANSSVNLEDLRPQMVSFLEKLEEILDKELVITSGFRGKDHPLEVKKTTPGEHSEGLACDIYCKTPVDFLKLVGEAYNLGCKRIGVSRKSGFVHLGLSPKRPSSLWTY